MEIYRTLEFRDPRSLAPHDLTIKSGDGLSPHQIHQLLTITAAVNRGMKLDQVLDELYESVRDIVPCNRLGLALIDVERKSAVSRWCRTDQPVMYIREGYHGFLKGSSLEGVLQSGHVRIINDLQAYLGEHPESHSTRLLLQEHLRSSLTCPLLIRDEPIGFLFFSSTHPNAYSDADTTFYSQIAAQVALVIEKARLYSDLSDYASTIERQNQAIRRDIALAAQLQRTFIPETPPQVRGLEVALQYEPLDEVGGDLVELIPLANDRLLVFLADAMGHGVSAALAMAVVKATFQAVIRSAPEEPGEILRQLNTALPPMLHTHFAAALAMIVEPATGHIELARAALPPPVIVSAATGECRTILEGGPPLSIDDSEPYPSTCICLEPGDTIILSTDGVMEATNDAGDQYGMDRLVQTACQVRMGGVRGCLDAVLADLMLFRNGQSPGDDLSIVMVRRTA